MSLVLQPKSRGCATCRKKKVKCDESRPFCQRCVKARRDCPGYQSQSDMMFRNMNSIAEVKVKNRVQSQLRARGSRGVLFPLHSGCAQDCALTHHVGCQVEMSNQFDISPHINIHWKETAVPRFFMDYSEKSDIVEGDLCFVRELANKPSSCPAFKEALNAIAYLSLGHQLHQEWLNLDAKDCFGRALSMAAHLIANFSEAKGDSTLATIYLFGLYQMIDGASGTIQEGLMMQDPHHHNGRMSLLRIRGDDQFQTPMGRSLFRANFTHLIIKSIITHEAPPQETEQWMKLMGAKDEPARLARCHLQVSRLCAEAQVFFDSEVRDKEWVVGLLQITKKAMILDLKYQEWSESLSGSWLPRIVRKSSKPPLSTSPSLAGDTRQPVQQQYLYPDNLVAFSVNTYRACRIHLLEVLLCFHSLIISHEYGKDLAVEFEEIRESSKATISELISDICSSVSFCLGDIDCNGNPATTSYRRPVGGYLLLWPLYVAVVSSENGSETEAFGRERLEYIGNNMGITLAHKMITKSHYDPSHGFWSHNRQEPPFFLHAENSHLL